MLYRVSNDLVSVDVVVATNDASKQTKQNKRLMISNCTNINEQQLTIAYGRFRRADEASDIERRHRRQLDHRASSARRKPCRLFVVVVLAHVWFGFSVVAQWRAEAF
jgi:hypothetical protein